jgi:hypothetical protein
MSFLGKALGVLPETQLLKPISDLLHRGSVPYAGFIARAGNVSEKLETVDNIFLASGCTWKAGSRTAGRPSRFCPTAVLPPRAAAHASDQQRLPGQVPGSEKTRQQPPRRGPGGYYLAQGESGKVVPVTGTSGEQQPRSARGRERGLEREVG